VKDDLYTVPTLDELAADPVRVATLPTDTAKVLLAKVAGLHALLLTSAMAAPPSSSINAADRFLNASEVGAMIGKSVSWVEKHVDELPKRRRVGGEGVWSEREVQAWMRRRETWD
jgi:predicted DNA-binding transcriptional regulator AlpA